MKTGQTYAHSNGAAIKDEMQGFVFLARLKLDRNSIRVDQRAVPLSPDMSVSAEIKTGQRRFSCPRF